ncbi:MAG: hypothetical protein HY699_20085 [Deltaproteobacteria bacterium]|nr:hypothetical protein [Deltaproteobacteria bacterium]
MVSTTAPGSVAGNHCGGDLSAKSIARLGVELFFASFVVLFQELALIRWLPGQVRALAYFPNLILLSAFLGLGLGCLRAGRRPLLWLWPVSLLVVIAAGFAMSRVAFTQNSVTEHLWLLYYDLPHDAAVVGDVRLPIVLAFVLSALAFVPLGQLVAERLREFQARSGALWGYCCDILGSLAGVITFAACGFLETFPVIWFAVVLLAGFVFFTAQGRLRPAYGAVAALALVLVAQAERAERYSPYYAIRASQEPGGAGVEILANGSLHQVAVSFDETRPAVNDWHKSVRIGYHVPYRFLPQPPRRVLVLGAGTGNDVAVALAEGAEQVDAVEIDPVILQLGVTRHPDRPYAPARVRAINTDARSFLNESREEYDLIVFGTLDSMTRLSALSNVRLDNFVYTRDCLHAARARLSPRGGIVMYFAVGTSYIDDRLAGMLFEAFGEPPIVIRRFSQLFNTIYMGGPAFAGQLPDERAAIGAYFAQAQGVELPDDDWPYLYLQGRTISGFYLTLMAVFATLALAGVAAASGEMRRSLSSRRRMDTEMFCFGLAFLLLETKSVTAMNLVWGATWLTSAIVFGAILAMVLFATGWMQLRPIPWTVSVAGLVVSLLLAYFTPVHLLLRLNLAVKLGLSALFVGTPIFFASACFALLFRERAEADVAFGWNLLGAVAGGLLECLSMVIGIKALSLVALLAYMVAVLVRLRAQAAAAAPLTVTAVGGGKLAAPL